MSEVSIIELGYCEMYETELHSLLGNNSEIIGTLSLFSFSKY